MNIGQQDAQHLTYCLNVHRGESWDEVQAAIQSKCCQIRDRVSTGKPFGLGLRLSDRASQELNNPDTLAQFKDLLSKENLYVFTINGFPYGSFAGTAVKTNVYQPDWRSEKRLEYSNRLATILAELLPDACEGSISTVPGSYKSWIQNSDDIQAMTTQIGRCATFLHQLHEDTGKTIRLALEPEPDCFLETTAESIAYFQDHLFADPSPHMQDYVGICFDTCHIALQYENLSDSLNSIQQAGIRIPKLQISNALEVNNPAMNIEALKQFDEPVYLHQVKEQMEDGNIKSYTDLSDALETSDKLDGQNGAHWRIHFHVPLFFEAHEGLASTAKCLDSGFWKAISSLAIQHLEIETYTYDVLPESLKQADVVEQISQEYEWCLQRLDSSVET